MCIYVKAIMLALLRRQGRGTARTPSSVSKLEAYFMQPVLVLVEHRRHPGEGGDVADRGHLGRPAPAARRQATSATAGDR